MCEGENGKEKAISYEWLTNFFGFDQIGQKTLDAENSKGKQSL